MSNQTTQSLFAATDTIEAGGGTYSRVASVQSRGQVAVYVNNASGQSMTINVLAGSAAPGQAGGRNSLTDGAEADALFPLLEKDLSAVVTFTVASGAKRCVDLAPFSPEFVGIQAISASGSVTGVTAYASAHA